MSDLSLYICHPNNQITTQNIENYSFFEKKVSLQKYVLHIQIQFSIEYVLLIYR